MLTNMQSILREQLRQVGILHSSSYNPILGRPLRKEICGEKRWVFEIMHPTTRLQKLYCGNRVAKRLLRKGWLRSLNCWEAILEHNLVVKLNFAVLLSIGSTRSYRFWLWSTHLHQIRCIHLLHEEFGTSLAAKFLTQTLSYVSIQHMVYVDDDDYTVVS